MATKPTHQERIAKITAARDRRLEALRLWLSGQSLKQIGAHFGVSRQRAHQMIVESKNEQHES